MPQKEMNIHPMKEIQKVTSNIIWVAVSQVIALLVGLVTLPALTKCYPSDIYGVWVQSFVTVGLLSPILTLNLGTALVRFLAVEKDKEIWNRAFGAMVWLIVIFSSLLFILSVLFRRHLSILLFADPIYASFIPLIFLLALVEALFLFSISYLRSREKLKRLSVIQIALAVSKMVFIPTLATKGYSLSWVIASVIVMEALLVALILTMIVKEIGFPKPGFAGLKRYLSFSIPMIPVGLLLWIINSSDRYFIVHLLNLSQAGIYSVSYTLGSLIGLFFSPITFVIYPTISRLWEQNNLLGVKLYLEYSTKLFLTFAIPGAMGLYVLSQPLLRILTSSEYMVGGRLVLMIALGTILFGIWQINLFIINLVQQNKWLPLIVATPAFTNAGINLALIPKIGIIGAAISSIVSYFILATIVTVWARNVVNYKIDFVFLVKVITATIVMTLCLELMKIDRLLSIILAIVSGAIIFSLLLLLLRTFSKQDKSLIMEAIDGLKLNKFLSRGNSHN